MRELFETILILTSIGFCLTALLLFIKPVTAKKFPAGWQYYVWIAVLLTMVIPIHKLIPGQQVQKIRYIAHMEAPASTPVPAVPIPDVSQKLHQEPNSIEEEIPLPAKVPIKLLVALTVLWILGAGIFMAVVLTSYLVFLKNKRKNAVYIEEVSMLTGVKKKLGIKRNISIRMSPDIGSPMLVGVFFPVIYMPCREITPEMLNLVFLHELTHYKRKDLLIKWFAVFVNAIHWFNPLSYLLTSNLSEACEISCDTKVTKEMNEEEQKLYMKTILTLVE